MSSWHSYPSIYNIGHKALESLFEGPLTIEEKIDGSQLSFGKFNGSLRIKSKNREFPIDAADGMFKNAADTVLSIVDKLVDGWTYRGEYLQKPNHNALTYSRVPNGHIILFDINPSEESYLTWIDKSTHAKELGLEVVPLLYEGFLTNSPESLEIFRRLIDKESCLGGPKMEGVVIKNYTQFGPDKKALFAKHVSEDFREVHKATWKISNPTKNDVIETISEMLKSEARWLKAVHKLRDNGELDGSPKDIGPLLKAVSGDLDKECLDLISEMLMKWALPQIKRKATHGLPEWYKDRLMASQFDSHGEGSE